MATKLQNELKSLRERAQEIEKVQGDAVWPDEAVKSYQTLIADAEKIRAQLDVQARADALKQWSEASDGQSAVRSSFNREAVYGEGIIPGVTQDESGELVATGDAGEATMKILKSGAYRDAFAQHMRAKSKMGPDWRSAMKGNAMKVLTAGADETGGFCETAGAADRD